MPAGGADLNYTDGAELNAQPLSQMLHAHRLATVAHHRLAGKRASRGQGQGSGGYIGV